MALNNALLLCQLTLLALCFLIVLMSESLVGWKEKLASHKPLCPSSATPAGTANTTAVVHPNLSGRTDAEQSNSEQ